MRIVLVTPAPAGSRAGNRVTAVRWGRILRDLGHRVQLLDRYQGEHADVLIALHARRSADSIARFAQEHPDRPLLVALTGTDLYGDLATDDTEAQRSLALAGRLIVLQPLAIETLPEAVRHKARVIYQSLPDMRFRRLEPRPNRFDVCVMGHLREVKDPLRTALASRLLPESSLVRVVHLGAALSEEMADLAQAEQWSNWRYRWLGEVPRRKALRILARCRLLSLTSQLEGGANVISEAITLGVPVVSSRIAGSVGLLGEDYPGYFPVGDTEGLAALLARAECSPEFLEDLQQRCEALRPLFSRAEERRRWQALLAEVEGGKEGR